MTDPVPHWPGGMVSLAGGEQVYVVETPAIAADTKNGLVLCVHGMSGAATNWTDFMAELSADFHCKAIDLPGSGYSPPPRRLAGYSIKALARTVLSLIAELNCGPVHLVGNSMGGAVCVRAAASRPDLVRTLTLISPALPERSLRREHLEFPLAGLPVVGRRLMRGFERIPAENRVAGVVATCYYDAAAVHPERFMLEVAELRRRDGLGYAPVALSRAARTIVGEYLRPGRYSLWRAAAQIPVPALVIFGSHDRLVSPGLAPKAARLFRDASVEVLPRTGHVAQMEHPGVVAARFREMVERAKGSIPRGDDPPYPPGIPGNEAGLTPDEVPSI